ncbi:cell wall hydrolase [uncultured Sphingomonas sp.]|uniref:cell wall hydrolase n=1 Tax=uncultured Sphingomonas sp. TaxID=158754 RepID=UPI0035CAC589
MAVWQVAGRLRNGALALVLLACLAWVHPAWRAIRDHREGLSTEMTQPSGFEAQDHFPGAALAYAADPVAPLSSARLELAAPAPGSTGTVAPPPEPVGSGMASVDPATTVVAARPFLLGHAGALDRGRALECLTAAIYYEAGNQSDDGERAVAQVVLNRVRHPAFPATVCGVVYQGSEHAGCQFSFACDGSMARARSRDGWVRALRIASDALAGQVFAPVGLATHYHTFAVTPAWNRALVMTDAIGAHFFHRWKGYWGTAAAFHQPWSEHEPVPGPHARLPDPASPALPLPASVMPVLAAVGAPAVTAATSIQPSHADAGNALAQSAAPASSLPSSSVLDRWKDSGTPLR